MSHILRLDHATGAGLSPGGRGGAPAARVRAGPFKKSRQKLAMKKSRLKLASAATDT